MPDARLAGTSIVSIRLGTELDGVEVRDIFVAIAVVVSEFTKITFDGFSDVGIWKVAGISPGSLDNRPKKIIVAPTRINNQNRIFITGVLNLFDALFILLSFYYSLTN